MTPSSAGTVESWKEDSRDNGKAKRVVFSRHSPARELVCLYDTGVFMFKLALRSSETTNQIRFLFSVPN